MILYLDFNWTSFFFPPHSRHAISVHKFKPISNWKKVVSVTMLVLVSASDVPGLTLLLATWLVIFIRFWAFPSLMESLLLWDVGELLQQLLLEFRGGDWLLYVTVNGASRAWGRHLIAVFMLSVWMGSRPTWTPPPASRAPGCLHLNLILGAF